MGVMDRRGRFIIRSLDHDRWVGKPVSPAWRAVMNREGWFDIPSVEGDIYTSTTLISPLSGWALGAAMQRGAFEAPIRRTILRRQPAGPGGDRGKRAARDLGRAADNPADQGAGGERRCPRPPRDAHSRADRGAGDRPGTARVRRGVETIISHEANLRCSEERLKLATEGAGVGTWELDSASGRGRWSAECVAFLGADRETFTRDDWFDVIHPQDRADVADRRRQALADGRPYEIEFRTAKGAADGGERWLAARGRIEQDAQGKPLRAAGDPDGRHGTPPRGGGAGRERSTPPRAGVGDAGGGRDPQR